MSGNSSTLIAFNYFGGKFTFLKELYRYFPSPGEFHHLVDLFAGSMVVSLNYEHNGRLIKTANEINEDITNFFHVLRDHEDELMDKIELTPCSFAEYENSWEYPEDKIERARRFYVRVRQSFFGLGVQRKNKGWHMAKKHANSNGGETVSRWNNSLPKLRTVAETIRRNFQITPWDCITCINKIDYDGAFFYCDPPYHHESRSGNSDYKFEFTDEDHKRLADRLHKIEGKAMISGYDCESMNELYGDWEKRKLSVKKNNIQSSDVQEVVWMNYSPPEEKSKQLDIFT